MPHPIDLITFDADQTISDFRAILAEALEASAAFLNPHLPQPVTPQALQALREEIFHRPGNANRKMLDLRRMSFLELLGDHPDAAKIAENAVHIFTDVRFNRTILLPGARDLLEQLHGQTRLGWITNGNSKPHHMGLDAYFDVVVVAEEIGHRKPEVEIFQHALVQTGTAPANWLHVGDHPETDVAGAQAAGGIGVYLENPDHPLGQITPDHQIAHLAELPALLSNYDLRPYAKGPK